MQSHLAVEPTPEYYFIALDAVNILKQQLEVLMIYSI